MTDLGDFYFSHGNSPGPSHRRCHEIRRFFSLILLCVSSARRRGGRDGLHRAARRRQAERQGQGHTLKRVIELRGRNGAQQLERLTPSPSPVRAAACARSSERGNHQRAHTGRARALARRWNSSRLNLDSDGVFTIVDQEAQKIRRCSNSGSTTRFAAAAAAARRCGPSSFSMDAVEGRDDADRRRLGRGRSTVRLRTHPRVTCPPIAISRAANRCCPWRWTTT